MGSDRDMAPAGHADATPGASGGVGLRIPGDGRQTLHAPGKFRAETVRNLAPWYQAFDVQPGQKMYLPPDQRVKIW